ncbi:MAG: hypothetical protein GY774_29480 [Planctomycetes bacterium]|nr:hypothetical protein [Planctomycetota bacterium]
MEPDINSEKWSPPSENQSQPSTGSQPPKKSFFEQECLQQPWMNVKLATWIKCVIVIAVLFAVAAYVAPKLSTAQSTRQQKTNEFSEYQCEKGSWIDANECFLD